MTFTQFLESQKITIVHETSRYRTPWVAYKEGTKIMSDFPSKHLLLECLKAFLSYKD